MDPTTTPPPAKKTAKTKAPRKPSAPRTIDPEIARLRELHKASVAKLRKDRASAKMLDKLTAKISKLAPHDQERLRESLGAPAAPE